MLSILKNTLYKRYLELRIQKKWRRLNQHNITEAGSVQGLLFPLSKVKVGNETYGTLNVYSYGSDDENLEIGSYCSIAGNVNFVLGGMHDYNKVTTFPFKKIKKNIIESFSKGPIIVEDDVWIGFGSTVLSGVTLGQGSIIAAGSVVVKSTEPYSIYGGNPAKLIRYRFDTETIKGLLKLDFNVINQSEIDFKSLYSIPNSQNILALVSKINKNG